jgi:hypothetical protein
MFIASTRRGSQPSSVGAASNRSTGPLRPNESAAPAGFAPQHAAPTELCQPTEPVVIFRPLQILEQLKSAHGRCG